ncbi:hypothetical protein [Nonomuraea dietziae]
MPTCSFRARRPRLAAHVADGRSTIRAALFDLSGRPLGDPG